MRNFNEVFKKDVTYDNIKSHKKAGLHLTIPVVLWLKNYGLCPSHYLSAPGLSWDATLKMTKIELELIPDPDIYIFFEKGDGGGIFYISNRYSKANRKYLKPYNSKQESKHILYLEANNLYSYAMSKFLPTNGFK